MIASVILLCFVPVIGALSCHSCLHTYYHYHSLDYSIRIGSPLFNESFFKMSDDADCYHDPKRTMEKQCNSFCIAQYISEKTYKERQHTNHRMIFRACADDVLLGTFNMDGMTTCNGHVKDYSEKHWGFPDTREENVNWEYGKGIACTTNLCNSGSVHSITSIDTYTCNPCENMEGCVSNCESLDGYTAQCDCKIMRNKTVTCASHHHPTSKTIAVTTKLTTFDEITTTVSIEKTSTTATTMKLTSTFKNTTTVTKTSTTSRTNAATSTTSKKSTASSKSSAPSSTVSSKTTKPTTASSESVSSSALTPQTTKSTSDQPKSSSLEAGYIALIVIYVIIFGQLLILSVLIAMYKLSQSDTVFVENVEMALLKD